MWKYLLKDRTRLWLPLQDYSKSSVKLNHEVRVQQTYTRKNAKLLHLQEEYLQYCKRKEGNRWHMYKKVLFLWYDGENAVVSDTLAPIFRNRTQNTPIMYLVCTTDFCKLLKTNLRNIPLLPYTCIDRENIRNLANKLEKNIKQYGKRKQVTATSYHIHLNRAAPLHLKGDKCYGKQGIVMMLSLPYRRPISLLT